MSAPSSLPSQSRAARCGRAAFRSCCLLGSPAVVLLASDLFAQEVQPAGPAVDAGAAPVVPALAAPLPDELSPVGMFLHADIVVQVVMVGLALASLLTWTVWLSKIVELTRARRRARAAVRVLRAASGLPDAAAVLRGGQDVVARLVAAAEAEIRLSADCPQDGVKERLTWDLERIEAAASRRIALGMGLLATVGAVAPFVGLFGTVWGIMNSFIGISRAHTTNLAVVAPGIAEALLATAFGLVAAIPAVVIYNAFTRSIGGYRAILRDASVAILRLVSRDLDRPARPDAEGKPIRIATAPSLSVPEAAE